MIRALALGLCVAASGARAQSYLVDGPNPVIFAPLPTTATKLMVPSFSGATVILPFGFTFFGQPVTSVTMSIHGYLVLADGSAGESTNTDIPQLVMGSIPPTFIAPWWDQLTEGGTYRYLVTGSAPLRSITFEWAASGGVFQAQLFESTGQIRFIYGSMAPLTSNSASVGVQRQIGTGVSALSCTPGCASADWASLANKAIDFYTPSDLRVSRTSVDASGYAGVSYRASATIRNLGGHVATGVTVRFYLSTDAELSLASDAPLGDAVLTSVAALAEQAVSSSVLTIPAATAPGGYFIFAEVDPANAIVETDDTNNVSSPAAMTVGTPKGDLLVAAMVPPLTARPGAMVSVERTLRNAGNAAVGGFKYSWLLSDNAAVSVSDLALSVEVVSGLNAQQNQTATDVVALPAELKPGRYWLGLCVNYDAAATSLGFGLDEISYLNNCFTPTQVTVISADMLSVLTTSLDAATQLGSYGVTLQASGGSGAYQWSLSGGTLPAGLTLSPNGALAGQPAVIGTFSFEVTVASDGLSARQPLTLEVSSGVFPLALVDQALPSAQFSRPYRVSLVAVGGKPPYRWSIPLLPAGLALSREGVLEGRATDRGTHSIEVTVTDSSGAADSRTLELRVVEPSSLAIATVALPSAVLNRDFVQELKAVGGRAPYEWSLTRFQQLPENPTDQRGPVLAGFPPRFGVSIANGEQAFLRGTPALAGLFSLTFEVRDTAGIKDVASVLLLVSSDVGLAITTTQLPDAFVNQVYTVKLAHSGASGTPVVFSTPCIQQVTRADEPSSCAPTEATARLPAGLTLMEDGVISGKPSSVTGSYTFLIKVVDASGRQDTRGFSIRVQPDFSVSQRGCSSVDGLGVGLGLLLLSRLRRRRGLWLAMVLLGCGSAPKNLCATNNVSCQSPLSCDPNDGLCKCGGRGGVVCGEGFVCSAGNTCESTRQVDCSDKPGTSADVFDGACKCGGTGGQVCGANETCNANAKTCVAARNCTAVACGLNERCDSVSSRCLCGSLECAVGQTCAATNRCVADACSGVSCTSGNRCDAADGWCKCNGALCLSGEACACPVGSDGGCAASAMACRVGTACMGVSCASPSTCDPVDGRCKCGGPGGPVCGAVQVCGLGPPLQCQGGEQCASADGGAKACASGSSCDPEDGRCKCGGLGGEECSEAQVCIRTATSQACRLPCDVRNPSCPTATYCYFDSSAATPAAYCSPATDSKGEEAACTRSTACFATSPPRALHCAGLVVGQTGICRSYCDLAGGSSGCVQVPRAQNCVQIVGAPVGYGVCLPR